MALNLEHRVPPPVVAVLTAALMLLVAWLTPFLAFTVPLWIPISVAVLGVMVALSGVAQFLIAHTTVNPLKPETASALVAVGVYRFTRNPMYLGMLIVLIAWGIYLGNFGAIATAAAFVAYINRFQIAPEERALAARFGESFESYRQRVRRWV